MEMIHSCVETSPSAHAAGSYTACESAAPMVAVLGLRCSALKHWQKNILVSLIYRCVKLDFARAWWLQ